jgi:hypothetical protein
LVQGGLPNVDQSTRTHDSAGAPFGHQTRLTHQIKQLINPRLPRRVGIIKELLQNADDAAARSFQILIDWRFHPTAALPAPEVLD